MEIVRLTRMCTFFHSRYNLNYLILVIIRMNYQNSLQKNMRRGRPLSPLPSSYVINDWRLIKYINLVKSTFSFSVGDSP